MVSKHIGARLRAAIEAGSFETATALSEEYGEAAIGELRGAITAEERMAIAHEAAAFLEDRLHLARVMRSHIAAQIGAASRLCCYANTPAIDKTWSLDA